MIQEDIDEDVYHIDFTTASEWEIFIARLEEIIHDWKLNINRSNLVKPLQPNELLDGSWATKSENVMFADVEFNITRYYLEVAENDNDNEALLDGDSEIVKLQALEDMMSLNNDFIPIKFDGNTSHPHVLARWYGLRDFVVLTPARSYSVTSESKIKILLSSICIAINNSNCEVPMFIQVLEPWQNFFMGICEGRGVRAEFEMVHLKRIPPHCKHLTGLLNLFKSRLGISSTLQGDPVRVSARFSYTLRDWTNYIWAQEPPDFDFLQGEVGVGDLGTLPFGATFDPVSELILSAVWPDVLETVVVDSESYTDLDPNQSPNWFVSIKMADQPACLLSEYLSEFLHLCTIQRSMHDILGDLVLQDTGPDLSSSLSILTESRVPSISKVLEHSKGSKRKDKSAQGPISNDLLMPILYFLFPDADTINERPRSPYPETIGNTISRESNTAENLIGTGMKSAPVDGLVWRLAVVMAHAVHTLGGIKAAAHIWYEFCQELRYRWDQGIIIPGVAPGFPDSKTCLLNQKLQMLNCCIDRKNARSNAAMLNPECPSDESEDDEFFDCKMDEEGNSSEQDEDRLRPKHSLWNRPVGRQCRYGNLRLLKTGEYLYIPVTQEATPKTEDQLEEDAEVLLQLGTDTVGAELRSRLMSASLLSDMESFKAANPGSILQDFIRWYSPRDWIEDKDSEENGQVKGSLSARMQIPGNTWLEMWAAAKPVPARRQKRLFDDTREAEKVLHQLEAKQPSAAAQMMLGPLVHAVLLRLAQQVIPIELPGLTPAIKHMATKAQVLSRVQTSDMTKYLEICGEVACAEAMVAQVASLEHKLCPGKGQTSEMREFLATLVTQPQAAVPGGPHSDIGNRIRAMFSEAHKAAQMIYENDNTSPNDRGEPWSPLSTTIFRTATEKEFILRVNVPRPISSSMIVSHRLSVRLRKDDITMAGCFSQDTTFQ